MPPTSPPPFPRIAEVFEDDRKAMCEFVPILQRELRQAADGFVEAFDRKDAVLAGNLKHKLKTSLSLLDDPQLTAAIAAATQELREGKPGNTEQQRGIVRLLRVYAERLDMVLE